jgi:hypothetical protein
MATVCVNADRRERRFDRLTINPTSDRDCRNKPFINTPARENVGE